MTPENNIVNFKFTDEARNDFEKDKKIHISLNGHYLTFTNIEGFHYKSNQSDKVLVCLANISSDNGFTTIGIAKTLDEAADMMKMYLTSVTQHSINKSISDEDVKLVMKEAMLDFLREKLTFDFLGSVIKKAFLTALYFREDVIFPELKTNVINAIKEGSKEALSKTKHS